jgi:APA family basic amino acid/polyamine antiporter
MSTLSHQLFRIKPVDVILAETGEDSSGAPGEDSSHLKRTMGLFALTMFSVGSIVGTGIFVILGTAVPKAGPAVLLSFVLAAVTCAFSALSYAELAGSIPVSGSSYSYAYATLGELIAWIVGWCLMLEYGVSVAAVAVGWGQYLNEFFHDTTGWELPDAWSQPPGDGGTVNITAILVVVLCMILLLRGASESATANSIMVCVKIGILLFFCVVAFTEFDPANLTPFLPLGFAGVSAAAGQVFFSYIGFDAASTAGEEAKNPRRDLPIAILASLGIVTLIYVLVTLAALGALPWVDFEGKGGEAVLATIAREVTNSAWAPALISFGAVVSIFSVVLVVMYGQTRILFAMGRDGLLPKIFTKVNPRTQTPVANTIIVTVIISILAGFVPLGQLAEATSIGTLVAFAIVNIGVVVLWLRRPDLERTFRTPLFPLMPMLGVVFNVYLVSSLAPITWLVFFSWMLLGLVFYFFYSRNHSTARTESQRVIPPVQAVPLLAGRRIGVSAVIAAVTVLVLAVVGVTQVMNSGSSAFGKVMWVLVVITGLVGAAAIVAGVQRERSAHALAGDGSGGSDAASGNAGASGTALDTAVASMRSGAWLVAIGFVVPAVLTAIAATASGQ